MKKRLRRWIGLLAAIVTVMGGVALAIHQQQDSQTFTDLYNQPQVYPDFIDIVQPEPGTIFSLSDPADRNLVYYSNNETRIICVLIMVQPLLRPYDNFHIFENVELTLDGRLVTTQLSHEPVALAAEGLEDKDGNIVATGVDSDTICWEHEIQPGKHLAELLIWTSTSEEFTYRWAFKVVR